jgi:DNA-binding transcriptional LysR family regulator
MRLEDLDFSKLRAFQLVAQEGSLKAAASKLRLTVSAVSAKLTRLEQLLGVELFRRQGKALALTGPGERLLAEIGPVLDGAERALSTVTSFSTEAGAVSIAVGGDYAWFFIPRLNQFWTRFPNFELNMRVYRAADALLALQKGQIDFCMGVYPRVPRGVLTQVVANSPFSLLHKSDAPQGSRLRIADVVQERLIAPRGSATRDLIAAYGGPLAAADTVECPTCQTAADLVSLGVGPAIVHTLCVERRLPAGVRAMDLGPRFGSVPFVVLYRKHALKRPALRFIFEQLTG